MSSPMNVYRRGTRHSSISVTPTDLNLHGTVHCQGTPRQRHYAQRRGSIMDSLRGLMVNRTRSTSMSSGYGSSSNGGSGDLESNGSGGRTDGAAAGDDCTTLTETSLEMLDDDAVEDDDIDDDVTYVVSRGRRHTCGARDTILIRNNSGPLSFEYLGGFDCKQNVYTQYLKATTCYDTMMSHAMVVAVDQAVPVGRALPVLLQTDTIEPRFTVWDANQNMHIGIITLTDMLYLLYVSEAAHDWVDRPLKWLLLQKHLLSGRLQPEYIAGVTPDTNLLDVVELMTECHVHRVPIFASADTKDELLSWVGWKRVLKTIYKQIKFTAKPDFLLESLDELRLGTWQSLKTVTASTTISDSLQLLFNHNLTALPVVDDNDVILHVITKTSIAHALIHLAAKRNLVLGAGTSVTGQPSSGKTSSQQLAAQATLYTDFLRLPVAFVTENDPVESATALTVNSGDPFLRLIERMTLADSKCLFVRNCAGVLLGVVTIHDVIDDLLTRPAQQQQQQALRAQHSVCEYSQCRETSGGGRRSAGGGARHASISYY